MATLLIQSTFTQHINFNLNTNIKANNLGNISLLHTNICSLQGNFDKLDVILDKLKIEFDVVTLTETWLDKDNVTYTRFIMGLSEIQGSTRFE